MSLRIQPYELELIHAFGVSYGVRTSTPSFIVELEYEGLIGYGEIVLPPYMVYTDIDVHAFFDQIDCKQLLADLNLESMLQYINHLTLQVMPAKAGIDIAIHDLIAQIENTTVGSYYELANDCTEVPKTSFTIGIESDVEVLREKVKEAQSYDVLKLKMGSEHDSFLLDIVLPLWNKSIVVDANQGWQDAAQLLHFVKRFEEHDLLFVEQPFKIEEHDVHYRDWKQFNIPIPIVADEALQTIDDLDEIAALYEGINVKLMKCGGVKAAYDLIQSAQAKGLKILIGCMTSSSCAIQAAAVLSPMADWIDLDGAFLIKNNPYPAPKLVQGRIDFTSNAGLAIR